MLILDLDMIDLQVNDEDHALLLLLCSLPKRHVHFKEALLH